jgi:hypothetical protein
VSEYAEAARIAFSGTSSWRRVWEIVPITKHDVAGIRSLEASNDARFERWHAVLRGWLHDEHTFEIEAGYEVENGCEVWARYRLLDVPEQQLSLLEDTTRAMAGLE